jgi:hypothetical protein
LLPEFLSSCPNPGHCYLLMGYPASVMQNASIVEIGRFAGFIVVRQLAWRYP